MHTLTIGFIGFGYIGGSIAKNIKRIYPLAKIIAYDIDTTGLDLAFADGIVDVKAPAVDDSFQTCNYVFLCTPVDANTSFLPSIEEHINRDCILTDVGSVKTNIHRQIASHLLNKRFIGGHPMAGSEKSGYAHANDHLLENAYYILTPTTEIEKEKTQIFSTFIASLGALPLIMDFQEHDTITAAVSHLPHIIASTLVNFIKDSDSETEIMKQIAAGGFKDITRIASSSPIMWEQICLTNKDNVLNTLTKYIHALEKIQLQIAMSEKKNIYNFFDTAKNYRDSLPISNAGPIHNVYDLFCDLIDEAGGIATLATILASNHISIKNIGILHNREFEEGVLRIEFYNEKARTASIELLRKYHYTVYIH